jgi:hypothetical protein
MTNHPEAALRALAEHGLRCDMNPTHDMSSLDASEEFWHRYLRMLDANVRQLATNALEAAPSPPDSSQGEPVSAWLEKFKVHLLSSGLKPCIVDALVAEERAEIAAGDCDCMNEHPEDVAEWEIDEIWSVLKSRDGLHGYGRTIPPPSSPQVAVAEFEDGAKCPLCGWRNTPPAPQSAVALNWRCDGFDHHGRVVAVEKIERRRFHVYALKDDRWQADFYADHELPEYIEVGKYPDARSAMRACDDFLHEGDTVDYSGGGDFDPTKLRHGEDEEAAPQSAPIEYPKHKAECPRCGLSITVYGFPAEEAAPKPADDTKAREGEPQARHCDWTDAEVAEFLSVAMRHVEIRGDLECAEIRQGVDAVTRARSLAQADKDKTP